MSWQEVEQLREDYLKVCADERLATEVQACNPCPKNDNRLSTARHAKSKVYFAYLHAFNIARASGVPHPNE